MALAFLFSLLRIKNPDFIVGDNPCGGVDAFVIDHKLRDGSAEEASSVVRELKKMRHIVPQRLEVDWPSILGAPDINPRTLPNLETAARRARYRLLGEACAKDGIDNLFLAHHADDQYETVLMRLLNGHPARGLVGMRLSNDIPECYDMHGIYQSGFLDLMRRKNPPLTYKMRKKEVYNLRKSLLSEIRSRLRISSEDTLQHLDIKPSPSSTTLPEDYFFIADEELDDSGNKHDKDSHGARQRQRPELPQLESEDGGVRICRPFLGFEKDRLRATCEANGIRWFEDHTNADPTLTTRNAVRYMAQNFELPEALRRPAVLRLSGALREAVQRDEEEASELLARTAIVDFRTNAGTMVVEFPEVEAGEGEDLERRRTVAALLVRRLIEVVSPETQFPMLPTLRGTVSRLFPQLATDAHPASNPPKPFNIASVLFTPLPPSPSPSPSPSPLPSSSSLSSSLPTDPPTKATTPRPRWFLSRAPHPSNEPVPKVTYVQRKGLPTRSDHIACKPHWTFVHKPWRLFDGRFWVRLSLRLAGTFRIAPFRAEHAKAFRRALGAEQRGRLEALLRAYAPGKVRYTLPAVYFAGEVDVAAKTARICRVASGREGRGEEMLLALPSLGVHLPGLEEMVEYEVRYKKVGEEVLGKCNIPADI